MTFLFLRVESTSVTDGLADPPSLTASTTLRLHAV